MRAAAAAVAVLAGVLVPVGIAAPPHVHLISGIAAQPVGTMAARATPAAAGARPASVRLTLGTEVQCGRLAGPIVVVFPAAERMPSSLPGGAVLVNGVAPSSVMLSGHVVSLALPKTTGISCDVIAPATVSIVFTTAAGLGNPATPGTYHVSVRVRGTTAVARLVVSQ